MIPIFTFHSFLSFSDALWFWYAVPFKRKLNLRSGGGIIGLFCRQKKQLARSVDFINASVDSEKIRVKTERYSFLGGGSFSLLEVHLKK